MRKTLFSITLLLCASTSIKAQVPQPLSLEEAINRALLANPSIEAAHFREKSAQQMARATAGLRWPNIDLVCNHTLLDSDIALNANHLKRPVQKIFSGLLGSGLDSGVITPALAEALKNGLSSLGNQSWSFPLQKRNFSLIGGTITAPLFTGGRINAAIEAARLTGEITHQQTLQAQNALTTKLVEQYFSLALTSQLITLRTEALDAINRHLHDAMALEAEGVIARSERLYMEYRKAQAEGDLQGAVLEHRSITDALRTTIADSATYYTITTPMFILRRLPPIETFQHSALSCNPLLAQASMAKELADEGVIAQRANYFPQIAAIGATRIYNHQLSHLAPRWAIGLSVSLKLFDGLNREYRHAAAKSDVRSAESLLHQARNDLTSLINGLYNRLLDAHNRIASLSTSITFAEAYLRDKEVAFREGLASATDLIDAELNLSKARIERLTAVCTYDITLAALLEASGLSCRFINYATDKKTNEIIFYDN